MSIKRPTPNEVKTVLIYEAGTGKLFWKYREKVDFPGSKNLQTWNARYAYKEAFTLKNEYGYPYGKVLGFTERAHRVIWAIETGDWPTLEIDHIDCDRSNNRFCNLRLATRHQNCQNARISKNNTSSVKGVTKHAGGWHARIQSGGRTLSLGVHKTIESAAAAYAKASAELHGEFGRTA